MCAVLWCYHAKCENCESTDAAKHFTVGRLELVVAVREVDDLGGTHEREVERVEEQHEVLALVVVQCDRLERQSGISAVVENEGAAFVTEALLTD